MFSQQKRIREENPEKYLQFSRSNLNSIKSLNSQYEFSLFVCDLKCEHKKVAPSSAYRVQTISASFAKENANIIEENQRLNKFFLHRNSGILIFLL